MELAGDILEEILELTGGCLLPMLILDGVLGITDPAVTLVDLVSTFFLEIFTLTLVPEEQLLDDEDGLVVSVLSVVDEPEADDLELTEGFGTALRGPITPVTFDPCIPDFAV